MLLKTFCSFLVLASMSVASPASEKHWSKDVSFKSSVRERLAGPPAGWVKDESVNVDKDSTMSLRIHLVHQDMDKFHELAMNIATPGHELYGAHLSQEVINSMIAPKDESRELVMQWINRGELAEYSSLSPRGDSIIVQASISQIEKLLNAEYGAFVRIDTDESVVRTLEYSIPDVLQSHVDMVQPTTFFGLRTQRSGLRVSDSSFSTTEVAEAVAAVEGCFVPAVPATRTTPRTPPFDVTPKCLSNLYNFKSAINYTNGLMAIGGFLQQYPSYDDLEVFMRNYSTPANVAQNFTCVGVNQYAADPITHKNTTVLQCPRWNPSLDFGEANLDVQYARVITQAIPNVYYSVAGLGPWLGPGNSTNEPYLEFLNHLLTLNASALPNTLSISYGDDEDTVPLDYATNVCNLFSQLGARGVSVLVASGDAGVGGCKNRKTTFTTAFPAGCPWVTAVGGTQIFQSNGSEYAWADGGGGFSEVFARPSYQNSTVNKWLASDSTHNINYFTPSGRAYPDVSAQAWNFAVAMQGSLTGVSGTSAATPAFASIIQLLNSDRLASGKTGLGFLNPWLYANATAGLNDIINGQNVGVNCNRVSIPGFNAVAGWDPATGLGTPNFESLLKISKTT